MRLRFFLSARISVSALISVLWLSGCSELPPELPYCRQSVTEVIPTGTPAACVVSDGRYLLVVKHRLSGKFDLPAGQGLASESAACTAHRETFEETGLNVEVFEFAGQSTTGLYFFKCRQVSGFSAPDFPPPVPFWQQHEISNVVWIDPYEISADDWRFPDQLIEVRAAFANR